jgi:inosine/xanthosine triphosphate pyrophosphatase family protein
MKKIIIGTQNQAKIKQIKGALVDLDICVEGLKSKIDVEENGVTAEDNARLKATAYSKHTKGLVLSMDNALYLDGLLDREQPKLNVRRIPGSTGRPTDDEILKYYISVIERLGGKTGGEWHFAICVADNGKIVNETTIISPRTFVSKSGKNIVEGYPLESIQIDPESKKYISDMTQDEQDKFWQKTIGKQLCDFVELVFK